MVPRIYSTSDLISRFSILFTSLATIFLISSIAFEYMYFWTIDWNMIMLLSPSDYVKFSIYWIPAAIALGSIGFWINYIDISERFQILETYGEEGLRERRPADRFILYCSSAIILISLFIIPFTRWDTIFLLQLPVYLCLMYLLGSKFKRGGLLRTERPQEGIMIYAFVVFLIVSALFSGINRGRNDLDKQNPAYELTILDKKINIFLMRSLDKGIIYHEIDDSHVIFLPWDKINGIKSENIEFTKKNLYRYVYDKIYNK